MKSNLPLISIILPVYNGEQYLAQSIDSCLAQAYQNFELLIVNDCSTDNTLSIAKTYQTKDKRVRVIDNQTNKRLPASLNIGHKEAKGDLMTWTSDDNLFLPNALQEMYLQMQSEEVDFVYADFIQIDSEGKDRRTFHLAAPEELLWRNVVGACFLYKKEVFLKNKGYDEQLFMVEDYDFWIRAFFEFEFSHLSTVLYKYRVHNSSLTSELNNENSEKKQIFEVNKYKMFTYVFDKYHFPKALQELIIEFQKSHTVDYKLVVINYATIKSFYKKLQVGNYAIHMTCLKDKFIKGIRQEKEHQGILNFIRLFVLFGSYLTINDYKTAIKILTHKLFYK